MYFIPTAALSDFQQLIHIYASGPLVIGALTGLINKVGKLYNAPHIIYGISSWLRTGTNAGSHADGRSIDVSRFKINVTDSTSEEFRYVDTKTSSNWDPFITSLLLLENEGCISQVLASNFISDVRLSNILPDKRTTCTADTLVKLMDDKKISNTSVSVIKHLRDLLPTHQDHIHVTISRQVNFNRLTSLINYTNEELVRKIEYLRQRYPDISPLKNFI